MYLSGLYFILNPTDYIINHMNCFLIDTNVCAQKSSKLTCPGFDPVTPLKLLRLLTAITSTEYSTSEAKCSVRLKFHAIMHSSSVIIILSFKNRQKIYQHQIENILNIMSKHINI